MQHRGACRILRKYDVEEYNAKLGDGRAVRIRRFSLLENTEKVRIQHNKHAISSF